jgi:outer membrane protein OmpA-like peptidoglycan-associated protein
LKSVVFLICFFVCNELISQSSDSTYVFYFNTNEFQISNDSILKFNLFIKKFENYKSCVAKIIAKADKSGSIKNNQILAKKRAREVKKLIPNSFEIIEKILGEKLAQNTTNNQIFRSVQLTVSCNSTDHKSTINLNQQQKREKEFDKRSVPIRLNILFHSNSTQLLEESYLDLNLLLNYLKNNPFVKAKFEGHVCCGDDLMLSKNRAFFVYNFMHKRGIDRMRMNYEGFSNYKPIVKEINETTQQLNRRVEVILTE